MWKISLHVPLIYFVFPPKSTLVNKKLLFLVLNYKEAISSNIYMYTHSHEVGFAQNHVNIITVN